jgi:hypothetical protein
MCGGGGACVCEKWEREWEMSVVVVFAASECVDARTEDARTEDARTEDSAFP